MAAVPLSALIVSGGLPPSGTTTPEKPGRPAHHLNDSKDSFVNPWSSFQAQTWGVKTFLTIAQDMRKLKIPDNISSLLPVIKPTWGADAEPNKIKATWLGHACFLLEFPTPPGAARGPRILFDPVFSHRCSPVQFMGPARFTPAPCKIEEIPQVDAIVISHNHYDHLDTHTINTLRKQASGPPHIFAPLNNDAYFLSLKIPKSDFSCLDWWESRDCAISLPRLATQSVAVQTTFRVTCTPAQHFTGRGLQDRFKTLWASWAVESVGAEKDVKTWFAGDTGYRAVPDGADEEKMPVCPAFKEIGEKFGGFDLALIPIGAYLPRQLMSPVHCAPQDSVRVFQDVQARRALGMHWGAWTLTTEDVLEPPKKLKEECEKIGIEGKFDTCKIGETVVV